jgi:predicted MFS family arabinose efflux permease
VALCLAGTLWFAAQRDTEPSAVRLAPSSSPERDQLAAGSRSRLAAPGLAVMVPVYLFIGGMFVSIDLSTVAFAAHFGHKALSGLILGVYAAGSGTGGLWYGSRTWRAPASRRLAVTLTMTVAGEATFWAMPNLAALTVVIFLCGMTIAPTLIAGFSLLESTALPGRVTEAMSWLSTGIAIGVAAGSTAVGFILDAAGPRWGYVFAASCGFVAVIVYLSGLALSPSLRAA